MVKPDIHKRNERPGLAYHEMLPGAARSICHTLLDFFFFFNFFIVVFIPDIKENSY
jgi:hypothetical protein